MVVEKEALAVVVAIGMLMQREVVMVPERVVVEEGATAAPHAREWLLLLLPAASKILKTRDQIEGRERQIRSQQC